MKTYSAKLKDIKRDWYIIDAKGLVLGRLAAIVSKYLRGKHKTMYSPNLDCGDNIVIINAEKIALTGFKKLRKKYFWHTGYPGGIKDTTAKDVLEGDYPERVVFKAIQRMLPRSPLGRQQMRKLHIYAGEEHPHTAQNPKALDVKSLNRKNSLS